MLLPLAPAAPPPRITIVVSADIDTENVMGNEERKLGREGEQVPFYSQAGTQVRYQTSIKRRSTSSLHIDDSSL